MGSTNLEAIIRRFQLPDTAVSLSKLRKVDSETRQGKNYFVYDSPDLQTKILLDSRTAKVADSAKYPYRGVDLGTYPFRALREFFYMPNRDTVSEVLFNSERHRKWSADVPWNSPTINVHGQNGTAGHVFRHEYVHCVSKSNRDLIRAYEVANRLDNKMQISNYATKNSGESLAETLGSGLLANSGERFLWTAHNNPLRSFVANRFLIRELHSVRPSSRSLHHDLFVDRARYVDEVTPPLVKPILEAAASKPGSSRQVVRTLLGDLQARDPEAANLISSPRLQRYLAVGGRFAPLIDRFQQKTDPNQLLAAMLLGRLPSYLEPAK